MVRLSRSQRSGRTPMLNKLAANSISGTNYPINNVIRFLTPTEILMSSTHQAALQCVGQIADLICCLYVSTWLPWQECDATNLIWCNFPLRRQLMAEISTRLRIRFIRLIMSACRLDPPPALAPLGGGGKTARWLGTHLPSDSPVSSAANALQENILMEIPNLGFYTALCKWCLKMILIKVFTTRL